MIYFACSLKIRIYLICSHVKSNRCLRISSTHAISNTFSQFWNLIQIRITSYLNTTISFAFETIKFEILKSTYARENLSRQFSILIHFSMISQSSSICKRRQRHFLTHLFSNCFTSNASRVEEISILKKYWFEEITKVVCFSNLSLLISSRESHYFERVLNRVNLFCFYFFRSLYHSFEETSDCYLWESLACCCFIVSFASHFVIIYFALLWESHWFVKIKSLFLLICKDMIVLLCCCFVLI